MQEYGDSTQPNLVSRTGGKGLQWKAWEQWFKSCPQNKTFQKDIVYLGAASSKSVGYILSSNYKLNRWDFFKVNTDTSQYSKFLDRGVAVDQCDFSKISGFSFDMIASGNFLKSVSADLGLLVQNSKSITITAGTWRIESIDAGPFMVYVNTSKDPWIIAYKEALLNDDNIVLTKVLKISGFEAEIEAKDSIGIGLKSTLQNGYNVNVIPKDSSRKIGFNLKFQTISDKKVKVSSTGEFSLFGQASKGTDL